MAIKKCEIKLKISKNVKILFIIGGKNNNLKLMLVKNYCIKL